MRMFVNPPGRRRRKRRAVAANRPRKRRRSAAQRAATRRMIAARKAKISTNTGGKMARRKRRSAARSVRRSTGRRRVAAVRVAVNPRRRRASLARRRYRRNPSFAGAARGVVGHLTNGAAVVGGRFGTGWIGSYLSGIIPSLGVSAEIQKALGETIAAFVVGMVAGNVRALGKYQSYVIAGAYSRPMETLIRSAGIDTINTGLSLGAYPSVRSMPGVSSYPRNQLPAGMVPSVSAYPGRAGVMSGDPSDEQSYYR